jgi:hypothetical protein
MAAINAVAFKTRAQAREIPLELAPALRNRDAAFQ